MRAVTLQEEGDISLPFVRKGGGAEELDTVKQGHPVGATFKSERIKDTFRVEW